MAFAICYLLSLTKEPALLGGITLCDSLGNELQNNMPLNVMVVL